MPPRNVSGFMRQNTDHLIWRLGLFQQPGVHEDTLATGDKGVD